MCNYFVSTVPSFISVIRPKRMQKNNIHGHEAPNSIIASKTNRRSKIQMQTKIQRRNVLELYGHSILPLTYAAQGKVMDICLSLTGNVLFVYIDGAPYYHWSIWPILHLPELIAHIIKARTSPTTNSADRSRGNGATIFIFVNPEQQRNGEHDENA